MGLPPPHTPSKAKQRERADLGDQGAVTRGRGCTCAFSLTVWKRADSSESDLRRSEFLTGRQEEMDRIIQILLRKRKRGSL